MKQAIIVEGKYDKIKINSIVDAIIITTDGFQIYKNKEKMSLIRNFAMKDGIIILTDSDEAGFKIRNHIKGSIPNGKITNIFIPEIVGKEKRKIKPSAAGILGVEGIDSQILKNAFDKAGITSDESNPKSSFIDRQILFDDGLIGSANSSEKRHKLLIELGLPKLLSVNSIIEVLNTLFSEDEYRQALKRIN